MASHNPPMPPPLYFLSHSVKSPAFISEAEFPTAAESLTTTQQTSVFLPLPPPRKTHKQTFELRLFNKACHLSRLLPQALSTFGQFFGSPPHSIGRTTRRHKKFTGRLHAPDHTACIMHSRSWRNPRFHSISVPSHIVRRDLINSSPRRFLHPLALTWQSPVGKAGIFSTSGSSYHDSTYFIQAATPLPVNPAFQFPPTFHSPCS